MRFPLRVTVAAAAALLALGACGSDSGGDSADDRVPASDSQSPTPDGQSAPAPSPDAAQTRALVTALKAIAPELAADEGDVVRGSVTACEALAAGVPRETVVDQTAAGFGEGARGGEVDRATADRIVAAVETAFCKV
ncbi:hypothetical protein [Streptomyces capparidis]